MVAGVEAADRMKAYEEAFADLDGPFAFVDLDALDANARRLVAMGAGKRLRLASKSVRCTAILRHVLQLHPTFQGLLTFTLPESVWLLGQGFGDLVVGYPTTDREALAQLARVDGELPALM